MLRINAKSSAKNTHEYFFGYYSEQELNQSKWYGKAAEKLGLSGRVKSEDFKSLCNNLNPETNERLTARQNEDRRIGYDFTFSMPKSVSLAYAFTGDKEIPEVLEKSIVETFKEIENNSYS